MFDLSGEKIKNIETGVQEINISKKYLIKKPPGHKLDIDEKKRILHNYWTLKLYKDFYDRSDYWIQTLLSQLNSCSITTVKKAIDSDGEYF